MSHSLKKQEKIELLEQSLSLGEKIKDQKVKTLGKTIQLKVAEINKLNSELKDSLSKSDEDFSNLELENEKLRNIQSILIETSEWVDPNEKPAKEKEEDQRLLKPSDFFGI